MSTKPYNPARCRNNKCELKDFCLRFAKDTEVFKYKVFFYPEGGKDCEYFIEVE